MRWQFSDSNAKCTSSAMETESRSLTGQLADDRVYAIPNRMRPRRTRIVLRSHWDKWNFEQMLGQSFRVIDHFLAQLTQFCEMLSSLRNASGSIVWCNATTQSHALTRLQRTQTNVMNFDRGNKFGAVNLYGTLLTALLISAFASSQNVLSIKSPYTYQFGVLECHARFRFPWKQKFPVYFFFPPNVWCFFFFFFQKFVESTSSAADVRHCKFCSRFFSMNENDGRCLRQISFLFFEWDSVKFIYYPQKWCMHIDWWIFE